MNNADFWDVAPCSSCESNRRFGGTCRLHLQGRKIRWFIASGFFYPEDGGDTFLRNIGLIHRSYTAPHPRRQHSTLTENNKTVSV
jgi:hypothetical protein